jgi:hypothetical protein
MDQTFMPLRKEIEIDGSQETVTSFKFDNYEGCTVGEAAKIFGVRESTVWHYLARNFIPSFRPSRKQVQEMKKLGLIHKQTSTLRILDAKSMRSVASSIGSERAIASCISLWGNP